MRKLFTSIVLFAAALPFSYAQKKIAGFGEKAAASQMQLEQKFDALLSAPRVGETIKDLSAVPHHVGSAGGKSVAENILAKYKSWGWDAQLETYQVLFPTPKTRVLEMLSPTVFKALLKEPALKEDATSGQSEQLPTYNAWSADEMLQQILVL